MSQAHQIGMANLSVRCDALKLAATNAIIRHESRCLHLNEACLASVWVFKIMHARQSLYIQGAPRPARAMTCISQHQPGPMVLLEHNTDPTPNTIHLVHS